MIGSYCSLLQCTTNLSQSSTTYCELTTVFVETWYGRNENLIHVARTQWQRNKNGIKSFAVRATSKGTVASLCYVSITSSRFLLGSHHECTTSYLRYVLATDFLKHVQNSFTSLKAFKTILCPYPFALRFRCIVEVLGRFT